MAEGTASGAGDKTSVAEAQHQWLGVQHQWLEVTTSEFGGTKLVALFTTAPEEIDYITL